MKNKISVIALLILVCSALGCKEFWEGYEQGKNRGAENTNQQQNAEIEKPREEIEFNPYQGDLADLLPRKISGTFSEFTLQSTEDMRSQLRPSEAEDVREIQKFRYAVSSETSENPSDFKHFALFQMPEGGETQTAPAASVEGFIANFKSEGSAREMFGEFSKQLGEGNQTPRKKGEQFLAYDGKQIAWINGTIVAFVKSESIKNLTDFAQNVPF